jgi:hypothetical protein
MFALLLTLLPVVEGFQPIYLETHTPPRSMDYGLKIAKELRLNLPRQQVLNIEGLRDYRKQFDTPRFESSQGIIWYLDKELLLRKVAFWTVPSRDRYFEFIENEVERRGGDVDVNLSGDAQVHLHNRTNPSGYRGIPDAWANYHNGLCISGSSNAIHQIDMRNASRWAKLANGKYATKVLSLEAIPGEYVRDVISALRKRANTSLQQRDKEEDAIHRFRKVLGIASVNALETALEGAKEIRMWAQLPDKESKFLFDLQVIIDPKSNFGRLVGSLQTRRQALTLQQSESNLAAGELHLQIPLEVRELAAELSADHIGQLPPSAYLLMKLLSSKTVDGVVIIPDNAGSPSLVSAWDFGDPFSHPFAGEKELVDGYRMKWDSEGSSLYAAIAHQPKPNTVVSSVNASPALKQRPVVKLSVDLNQWIAQSSNPAEASTKLLRKFENAFDAYSHSSSYRSMSSYLEASLSSPGKAKTTVAVPTMASMLRGNAPLGDFESLTMDLSTSGDWKVSGILRARAVGINVRVEVGAELYRTFRARQLLAAKRLVAQMPAGGATSPSSPKAPGDFDKVEPLNAETPKPDARVKQQKRP